MLFSSLLFSSLLSSSLQFPSLVKSLRSFFAFFLIAIVCNGCAVVGVGIQTVKDGGFTEPDRQQLLAKSIKEFHEVLFFGRVDVAMKHVDENLAITLAPRLVKQFRKEKMVEHAVDDTQFSPSSFEAEVKLTVKVFRNTDFLVKEREITEKWKFTIGGQWTMFNYVETEGDHAG